MKARNTETILNSALASDEAALVKEAGRHIFPRISQIYHFYPSTKTNPNLKSKNNPKQTFQSQRGGEASYDRAHQQKTTKHQPTKINPEASNFKRKNTHPITVWEQGSQSPPYKAKPTTT